MTTAPSKPYSVCPHDCPSACALEVDFQTDGQVGRLHGAKDNSYTAGVICAKVARYAERLYHPDRLTQPLKRTGSKGSGQFTAIGWDEALDTVAENLLRVERKYGAEAVWPYHYAGTMGLIMRDGLNRLRHAKGYSIQHSTICSALSYASFAAGTGALQGPDPREMAKSDLVVIWGTNAVNTQVHVMTHAIRARKERGAKIVCIDTYHNSTAQQADMALILRPGTDGALACAVMHVLFRDGHADQAYLQSHSDCPERLEAHLQDKTPEWAADITGLSVTEIEAFAKLVGQTPRAYFRLGFGFSRSRNGAVNMHAASCIPTVTGAWQHEGGGALHSNSGIYHWNKTVLEGLDVRDPSVRWLDQSHIGAILCGEDTALNGGPPVKALFIQNTNPMSVMPDHAKVRKGFAREDLFTCVHEQFMTDTAKMADMVLPATMFLEQDDIYQGGGHQHIMFGPKVVDAPGECRNNHEVVCALAERLGAEHDGFGMTPRQLIDRLLRDSGWGDLDNLEQNRWIDAQPPFEESHYLNGFAWPDGKFRFAPDWLEISTKAGSLAPDVSTMPPLPDHWAVTEEATADHPFRLVTAPARAYLNSSFTETPTSRKKEGHPTVKIHPEDAEAAGVSDGDLIRLRNSRGQIRLHAEIGGGQRRGVLVSETLWPNEAFVDGMGLNTLTGADSAAPVGGAALHDNRVALERVEETIT